MRHDDLVRGLDTARSALSPNAGCSPIYQQPPHLTDQPSFLATPPHSRLRPQITTSWPPRRGGRCRSHLCASPCAHHVLYCLVVGGTIIVRSRPHPPLPLLHPQALPEILRRPVLF